MYLSNGVSSKLVSSTIGQLNNQWIEKNINISQFIEPTSEMRVSFKVSDYNPYNHLVEAGIDGFEVYEDNSVFINYELVNEDIIYPNPAKNHINISIVGLKNIYSISGKFLISTNENVIDISMLKAGVYFINANEQFYKFVKL